MNSSTLPEPLKELAESRRARFAKERQECLAEAGSLMNSESFIQRRNCIRSLVDFYSLLLDDLSFLDIYMPNLEKLDPHHKFKFLKMQIAELNEFDNFHKELWEQRCRVAHDEKYVPSKEDCERLTQQADKFLNRMKKVEERLRTQKAPKEVVESFKGEINWMNKLFGQLKEYELIAGNYIKDFKTEVNFFKSLQNELDKFKPVEVTVFAFRLKSLNEALLSHLRFAEDFEADLALGIP